MSRPARRPSRLAQLSPDVVLAGVVLALVSFGLVMVYSASSAVAALSDGNPSGIALRQAMAAVLGVGAYLLMSRVSPAALQRFARPAMIVSVVLLLLVFLPGLGTAANGSRRWLALGALQIQPSELAKLAVVLWIAAAVASRPGRVRERDGLVPFLAVVAVPALLILVEPDLGTAVVVLVAAGAMLVVAGARPAHLGLAAVGASLLAGIAILTADYRRERLLAFIDPWSDPGGAGFQSVQAQLALGSGGISGTGVGDGLQKAFYLPEAHTDMILATVGEELGLIGVTAVLAAFVLFAIAGYRVALRAADLHQQLLAAGVTTLVTTQAVVNVGAVVGLMPVTGVPLPFVSYGGTSLVVVLASAGLLVNVARRSPDARRRLRVVPGEGGHRRGRDRGTRRAGAGGGRGAVAAGGRGELRGGTAGRR